MAVATTNAPRATVARVTRHIILFAIEFYLVAYIDRSNISVAALQMSGARYDGAIV
jgi:hypothetical protein